MAKRKRSPKIQAALDKLNDAVAKQEAEEQDDADRKRSSKRYRHTKNYFCKQKAA